MANKTRVQAWRLYHVPWEAVLLITHLKVYFLVPVLIFFYLALSQGVLCANLKQIFTCAI